VATELLYIPSRRLTSQYECQSSDSDGLRLTRELNTATDTLHCGQKPHTKVEPLIRELDEVDTVVRDHS
jgi:hypothetical protein